MKPRVALMVASMISILLFSFHLTDDILLGFEPGNLSNWGAFPIFVVWLYGTVVLAERRPGYVIMFIGSLLGFAVAVLHMSGRGMGLGGSAAKYGGHWFFVWTLIALGAAGLFGVTLSAHMLWSFLRSRRTETR